MQGNPLLSITTQAEGVTRYECVKDLTA